ncbi:hypothetical protein [Flaviaesturariibacter amylovorans]|uniref:Cupin domain-containing protein n=1 Tax=Flaviaesturariibacter amylovorans TaxID=1084520 RepID=A0ABP8HSR9_9BACT
MNRSRFLPGLLTAVPATAWAGFKSLPGDRKGFRVAAGEGRLHGHLRLKGVNANILDLRVSGKDANGALAIFEQTGLTPGKGTPLHVHHHQGEIFNVVEGE